MKTIKSGKLIMTSYKRESYHKSVTYSVACFVVDNRLEYFKVLPDDDALPVGSIITGKVKNIVPNIQAAFVALDSEQNMGFLSLHHLDHVIVTNRTFQGTLHQGDEVLLQITREPIKTKEAAVTTDIHVSGKYFVVQPGSGRLLFSKKLSSRVKELLLSFLSAKAFADRDKRLIGMDEVDITVRSEAANLCIFPRSEAESANAYIKHSKAFSSELTELVSAYRSLITKAAMRPCYTVHLKPVNWLDEMQRELASCGFQVEEYVSDDIQTVTALKELLCRDNDAFKDAPNIRLYQDTALSMQSLYGLNSKIEEILQKNVWLPSGGYLCIEPTEAMVVVDVNSGKSVRKGTDEEALFMTVNQEAAEEIIRQLRLRNLSGMIIVDFINMKHTENEEILKNMISEYAKHDFAKINIYDFTKLGLLEMTREKKSKALHEFF